jgi:hypothetical protein
MSLVLSLHLLYNVSMPVAVIQEDQTTTLLPCALGGGEVLGFNFAPPNSNPGPASYY